MSISLEQVSKHYDGAPAISDVSVEIAEGEFFVLLGPSGSGKSTLLRAIAGLTTIDRGRIVLHGRDVSNVSAREREVGFVFQNYALFRHMSVADNIEFALRARRVRAVERRRRVKELLALVSLEAYGDRLPAELSGGQQQRVAVARALAHEPRVLLLDEPFGALDAKIRDELRRSIRQIQRAVGITTILVTHDQEEAFTMADRIGVMDRGRLQETDEPKALYTRPRTRFVATFLGAANLLLGHHEPNGIRIGDSVFDMNRWPGAARPGAEATAVVRPEDVVLAWSDAQLSSSPIGRGTVEELEFVGVLERVRVKIAASESLTSVLGPCESEFVIEASRSARESETTPLTAGQRVSVGFERIHVLPSPISSVRIIADTEEESERLASSPLVRELAQRMHIAPTRHLFAGGARRTPLSGLSVVGIEPAAAFSPAVRLLERGAHQVLSVGSGAGRIERLVIYSQPSRSARDAALSVAGTLLRHLAVDATLLVPDADRQLPGTSYRELLDVRNAALHVHGVDVRTESFSGPVADAIGARADPAVPTLLLVGLTSTASAGGLVEALGAQLAARMPASLLLVRGSAEAVVDLIPQLDRPAAMHGR